MKKLILSLLACAAVLGMSAADYNVYRDGQLGDFAAYNWYNAAFTFGDTDPAGSDAKTFSMSATADNLAAASMGINAEKETVTTGPLHSATLNFDWYATTAGQKYTFRLTATAEQNYVINTTADNIGKWNHVELNVAEAFPTVSQQWKDNTNDGQGYVFSVILDNGVADSKIYLKDIYYSNIDDAWKAPTREELPKPTALPSIPEKAKNVISLNGLATPATGFNMGGWGQSTQMSDAVLENGTAKRIKNFNYLGWELAQHLDVSGCNTMHVEYFASNEGNFGFTPISPGKENVWTASEVKVGEWNSYDVPLTQWSNVDLTDIFQIKFDKGNGKQEGYIGNVYFYKDSSVKDPEYGAVWYGTASGNISQNGHDFPVDIDYAITANADKTLTMVATIEGTEKVEGIAYQLHTAGQWPAFTKTDNVNEYSVTSPNKFELGQKVSECFFYFPYSGGAFRVDIDYTFGTENEAPVQEPTLRISGNVTDITSSSAVLNYTVKASSEFDGIAVKVLLDGKEIGASPYTIPDLQPSTGYSLLLQARAELDGKTYESKPAAIEFKTLRDGAVAANWYAISDGYISNAYLPGEDPATSRRDIPVSIKSEIIYNPDQTITVNATYHGQEAVGLVPQITISSSDYKFEYKALTREGNKLTITTDTKYPEGENIGWLYYFFAYDGGSSTLNVNGYTTGAENEKAAYGAPAAIELKAAKTAFKVGESAPVAAIAKDAAGHFLLDENAELSSNSVSFEIEGNSIVAKLKGSAIITAATGDFSTTLEVICVNSAEVRNLYDATISTLESDHANPALAFDNNEGTQVEWSCAESEEHYITLDLGKTYDIESIELVWEGASATEYTVTLTDDDAPAARAAGAAVKAVYNVSDGEGGAGVTARKLLFGNDLKAVQARYVSLNTKKAFNAGWGIKLKEMRINGVEKGTSTVIDTIDVDENAPVVYYTLDGVRVSNPGRGLYIRVQGGKASKIFVM